MTRPDEAERERLVERWTKFKQRRMRGLEGMATAYSDALDLGDEMAAALSSPAPTAMAGEGAANRETILAYLDEAEAAWTVARDSSGYGQSASWAMDYGRKLIFDYRRAVQSWPQPAGGTGL